MRKPTRKQSKEVADTKDVKEFRRFIDTPGMKNALSRTISNADHAFDDSRTYPQSRVNAVTDACIEALRKTR